MSNEISKKVRNVRAKEGMSIEEFADFLNIESKKIENAEELGVMDFELAEKMNEICPEHLFFIMIDSFKNEDKKYQSNAAFRRKWANKNSFKIDLSKGERALTSEFEKYLELIEKDYKNSFGYKLLQIIEAEKLTYEKLNELTNTSESTLKKYSGNHVTPGLDFVQILCNLYPKYTMYLMFDEMPVTTTDDQITPEEKTLRDLNTKAANG